MKKLVLFLVLSCSLFMVASPAQALFRLGVHGGRDLYSIERESNRFQLTGDTLTVSLTREEITQPILFGGNICLDLIPVVDIELEVEAALAKYSFTYNAAKVTEKDAVFGRIALCATVKKNIVQFPPLAHVVSLYVGGGVGVHLVTPVISEALIVDELETSQDELDVSQIVGKAVSTGAHAVAGIRLKPPLVPFAIDVKAKYTILGKGEYEEPERFLTLSLGLGFGF